LFLYIGLTGRLQYRSSTFTLIVVVVGGGGGGGRGGAATTHTESLPHFLFYVGFTITLI
jgi:hypothetical protein